jgi:GMP synthase (glutamine-hydrolysing)
MLDARDDQDGAAPLGAGSGAKPRGRSKSPVLIVLHQEHSSAGHVGQQLVRRGFALDIRRPRFGDLLPETLARHAGAVIFGGPMSANDADDFVAREIGLVELALKEQRPYLGICLGAQMMAVCLGARVAPHPDAHVEIGYHDIKPLIVQSAPAADDVDLLGGRWPERVYQWHREGFDLPAGAEALAASEGAFANQAFRFGPAAVGVQFHPEITYAMVARWSGRNESRLDAPGARPRPAQLADHIGHGPEVLAWLGRFLEDWLALGHKASP